MVCLMDETKMNSQQENKHKLEEHNRIRIRC